MVVDIIGMFECNEYGIIGFNQWLWISLVCSMLADIIGMLNDGGYCWYVHL